MDKTASEEILTQIVDKLGKDEVPNVRFNVVKLVAELKSSFDIHKLKNVFMRLLEKLVTDKDPDVAYFAQTALDNLNEAH